MLKQIDHIGIVVKSLDSSLETLEKLFKLKAKYIEVVEDAGVRMAFIPVGEVMLELIEPPEELAYKDEKSGCWVNR
jgi:methylmalonyl-CoA/ethylmalonyl-CoA epimerase